jgi:hypothetical protein
LFTGDGEEFEDYSLSKMQPQTAQRNIPATKKITVKLTKPTNEYQIVLHP